MRKFLSMSFAVLAVAIIVGVTAGAAKADTVTFTTDARFNGGAFGAPVVIGGVTLSFQAISPASSVITPSNTSLGEIVVSCTGGGTACGLQDITGTTFDIRITQTVPSGGTGTITSILSGSIGGSQVTGTGITFTITSVTIGPVKYTVLNNPLALVPVTTNNGHTSIQAAVTTVPEPTTMLLLGTGLVGVAGAFRRRFKARL